jgi:biopolymer transport protein ExbB
MTPVLWEKILLTIIQAAGWPIWPLIVCSVVSLALIMERFFVLRGESIAPKGLLTQAMTASASGLPSNEAIAQLRDHSTLGRILSSGFMALQHDPYVNEAELQQALQTAGRHAAHDLEKRMTALATIASAAPLLGLLGTVIGMIEIFGSQAPGASNPVQLAQGISTALYNTAFGLIVAIPTLMFWRYFRAKVDGFVVDLEADTERFSRHLIQLRNRLR